MMPTPRTEKRASIERTRGAFPLFLILTFALALSGCNSSGNTQPGNSNVATTPKPSPTASSSKLTIDGERAFEHVRKQVEFGPRPAGSAELARTREYIVGELRSYNLNVMQDEFTAKTPVGDRKFVNVTAELPGESSDVIIFASHYDTKLYKEFRFVGANDGASSTATLLEMARVISASGQKPRFTYWFVFFDGEEAFCEDWNECKNPDGPDNTYGSRRYVKQLKEKNELRRVRSLILLDMVGYKNLQLGRNEILSTRWLIDAIWDTADEMGHGASFIDEEEHCDADDHLPFLQEGVEAIDIIQLDRYPHWHTAEDTLDKISPQSLKTVGDVVLASLQRIEQRLLSQRVS